MKSILLAWIGFAAPGFAQTNATTNTISAATNGSPGSLATNVNGATPIPAALAELDGVLSFSSSNGLSLRVEPKIIADSGALGFDYEAKWDKPLTGRPGVAELRFGLLVLSRGFIATKKDDNQDSLISEARFTGQLFAPEGGAAAPGTTDEEKKKNLGLNADNPFAAAPNLAPPAKQFYAESARFAIFDGHIKYETDQRFESYQIAGGAGLASDLGLITGNNWPARILDAPFAMTRSAAENAAFTPRLPRFYVGYDYVDATHNRSREAVTSDESLNRLTFQAAWSTRCFDYVELRASLQSYYEIDAGSAIKAAGKRWTSFVEVTAAIPLDAQRRKKLFVKYANGELPPTLKQASNVGIGFSLELGKQDE